MIPPKDSAAIEPCERILECRECHVAKSSSEFYRHPGGKGGLRARCKMCVRVQRRSYWTNAAKKIAVTRSIYEKKHWPAFLERSRAWKARNRHKVSAHNCLNRALRAGRKEAGVFKQADAALLRREERA